MLETPLKKAFSSTAPIADRPSTTQPSVSVSFVSSPSSAADGSAVKLSGATSVVGSPPSAVIFSTSRVASSSSASACSFILSAWAWYSRPITLPATSEYWITERCCSRSALLVKRASSSSDARPSSSFG